MRRRTIYLCNDDSTSRGICCSFLRSFRFERAVVVVWNGSDGMLYRWAVFSDRLPQCILCLRSLS